MKAMLLKKGQNPRQALANHRERGPTYPFKYTFEDIASRYGLKASAIRAAVSRGEIDPSDPATLGRWMATRNHLAEKNELRWLTKGARTLAGLEERKK